MNQRVLYPAISSSLELLRLVRQVRDMPSKDAVEVLDHLTTYSAALSLTLKSRRIAELTPDLKRITWTAEPESVDDEVETMIEGDQVTLQLATLTVALPLYADLAEEQYQDTEEYAEWSAEEHTNRRAVQYLSELLGLVNDELFEYIDLVRAVTWANRYDEMFSFDKEHDARVLEGLAVIGQIVTDDLKHTYCFDASRWFVTASSEVIRELVESECNIGDAITRIALDLASSEPGIQLVLDHVRTAYGTDANSEQKGYGVRIDFQGLISWLRVFRSDLAPPRAAAIE